MEKLLSQIVKYLSSFKILDDIANSFSKFMPVVIFLSLFQWLGKDHISFTHYHSILQIGIQVYLVLFAYDLIGRLVLKHKEFSPVMIILSFWTLSSFTVSNLPILIVWIGILSYLANLLNKSLLMMSKLKLAGGIADIIYGLVCNLMLVLSCGVLIIVLSKYSSSVFPVIDYIQTAVYSLMSNMVVYLIFSFLILLLWSFGYHGDRLLGQFIEPFLVILLLVNLSNRINGVEVYSIINISFHLVFFVGTGTGMTGALYIATIFLSKSRSKIKEINNLKEGMIFNINEPIIFGLPVAYNSDLRFAFILAPLVSVCFGYLMMKIHFIQPFTYAIHWITPPLLKSFLASGGDLKSVLVEFISYLLAFLVYAYYVLKQNKKEVY